MGLFRTWNSFWRREVRSGQSARRSRLQLELLEDRTVPSTFYVANSGQDAAGAGTAAAPFKSIQYAVNQANSSGDTILVGGGEYLQTDDPSAYANFTSLGTNAVVVVMNKSVTILGSYNPANWNAGPNFASTPTVIDGQSSYRGVLVLGTDTGQPSAAIDLENFYIQNGLARGNPTATGDDAIFGFGGGVFVNLGGQQNTSVTQVFNNDVFRNNVAIGENSSGAYGGAGVGGGMELRYAANTTLNNVTFQSNQARGGNGAIRGGQGIGGALDLDSSTISSATNVTFSGNFAGGGASAGVGTTSDGQRADGLGGAVSMEVNSNLVLVGSTASGNVVNGGTAGAQTGDTAGAGYGGAFAAEASNLSLSNCVVSGNSAMGGSSPTGGNAGGGGIDINDANLSLSQVTVLSNQAIAGISSTGTINGSVGGGGIYLFNITTNNAAATLANTVVANNAIDFGSPNGTFTNGGGGAGMWIQGVPTTIDQCTIADNTLGANLFYGSALLLIADQTTAGTTTASVSYSIIANNIGPIAANDNNGAVQSFAGTSVVLLRDLFAANNDDISSFGPNSENGGSITDTSSNPSLTVASAGFVSPGAPNNNYQLLSTSPALNQAVGSSMTVDRLNLTRASTPDIGAFELQSPAAPVLQLSAAAYDYFETDTLATVTVTRTGNSSGTSTVWIAAGGGTATPNSNTVNGDYNVPTSIPITFNPGDTFKTFNIVLHAANVAETPVIYFYVYLGSPSNATLGRTVSAVVSLVNNVPSDLSKFISGAYHTLLDQAVDATSFVNQFNLLYPTFQASLTNDAVSFLTSQEHFNTQIQTLYSTFLGRSADTAELNYWYGQYAFYSGQKATWASAYEHMLAELVGSAESVAHNTSASGTWLNAIYEGLLGRAVDPAGQKYFTPLMNAQQPSSYVNVVFQITQASEYRNKVVGDDFKAFLGRAGTTSQIAAFANLLATQPRYAMEAQLITSLEYFIKAGNSISGWVNQTYTLVMQRPADAGGATYHQTFILNGFASQRATVVNNIENTPAYEAVLVENAYQQILGRAAATSEVSYGLSFLTNHTIEQFRAALYGSPEYFQNKGGNSISSWLSQVYEDALGRAIDTGGFNFFVGQLNGGTSMTAAVSEILGSSEYYTKLTNTLFQQLLGRPASAAETSYYVGILLQGVGDARVVNLVEISPEAFAREQAQQFP